MSVRVWWLELSCASGSSAEEPEESCREESALGAAEAADLGAG